MRYTVLGDALGKFSQEGVAPGAYLVMVFTDGKGTDVLRHIQLRAGDTGQVTLRTGDPGTQIAATVRPTGELTRTSAPTR